MAGRKKTDILFVGRKGIGKSHLITALTNDIDKTKAADEHSWRLQEVDTSPAAENVSELQSALNGKTIQLIAMCIEMKDITNETNDDHKKYCEVAVKELNQAFQLGASGHMEICLETPVLSISDLQEVRCEVGNVAPKWQFLGQILGIHPDDLAKIECNSSKAERCLNEVLKMWLKQGYDTKRYPLPTRSVLCRAVANNNGGCDRALAIKIATKHRYDVLKNSL
ncbi:hypothetical protein EMCRGX_G000405 [Ephydatia muelleri]